MLADRYELVELVGTGGMAEVWRARDRRLGRDVAVKLVSGPAAADPSMRRRIEREGRAMASVTHPNIIAVFDHGEVTDEAGRPQPYVVMELVDGVDLERHLADQGALSAHDTAALMTAVLGAVGHAHDAGIVHGDLKPANVVLGSSGPKVGDFGVARILAEETGTTTVAATPSYAAPEVLRGERPTAASDIYSASCMAFAMLAGRPPFLGANAWDVASKHLEDPVPSLGEVRPEVPPELSAVIRRGMDKEPARRPASATELAGAIAGAANVEATERLSAGGVAAAGPGTERIGPRPDLAAVALLGPLAGLGVRARRVGARAAARARRSPRAVLGAAAVLLVLLLALTFFRSSPELVTVPDVRAQESAAAVQQLATLGLAADVSYRPVHDGEPDRVLETIPGPGTKVAPDDKIHLISSALVAPEPTPAPATPEPEDDAEDRAERGKRKGRDRDD